MIYLAYIVLAFCLMRFLVVLANLIFNVQLKSSNIEEQPFVSILIPARNEEKNIGNILHDISKLDYANFEVLVYDDQSEDKTATIVKRFASEEDRIKLIGSEGLPVGWLGKNFACHNLAENAKGDYLLFLDADVRIKIDLLKSIIPYILKSNLDLISIFPKQNMHSFGEKITVPIMNLILLSLLPLILTRISSLPSLSAANGQFMLFNARTYKKLLPHKKMKNKKVEDIYISRYLKKSGYRMECLAGTKLIECRMYSSFGEAINGFSKNVVAFFGNSIFLAISYWAITTFGFIPVLFSTPLNILILYVVICIMMRVLISLISNQSIINNLLYVFLQQFSLAMMIFKSVKNQIRKEGQWKGRRIG